MVAYHAATELPLEEIGYVRYNTLSERLTSVAYITTGNEVSFMQHIHILDNLFSEDQFAIKSVADCVSVNSFDTDLPELQQGAEEEQLSQGDGMDGLQTSSSSSSPSSNLTVKELIKYSIRVELDDDQIDDNEKEEAEVPADLTVQELIKYGIGVELDVDDTEKEEDGVPYLDHLPRSHLHHLPVGETDHHGDEELDQNERGNYDQDEEEEISHDDNQNKRPCPAIDAEILEQEQANSMQVSDGIDMNYPINSTLNTVEFKLEYQPEVAEGLEEWEDDREEECEGTAEEIEDCENNEAVGFEDSCNTCPPPRTGFVEIRKRWKGLFWKSTKKFASLCRGVLRSKGVNASSTIRALSLSDHAVTRHNMYLIIHNRRLKPSMLIIAPKKKFNPVIYVVKGKDETAANSSSGMRRHRPRHPTTFHPSEYSSSLKRLNNYAEVTLDFHRIGTAKLLKWKECIEAHIQWLKNCTYEQRMFHTHRR